MALEQETKVSIYIVHNKAKEVKSNYTVVLFLPPYIQRLLWVTWGIIKI